MMIFEKHFEVRYSELESSSRRMDYTGGHASLPSVVAYWQDTTMAQTAMLGRDAGTREETGKYVWFLLSWNAEFERYPAYGEKVVSQTWATGFKGVYGHRDFLLLSEDGERLAAASTVWAAMDPMSGKLRRCTQAVADIYGTDSARALRFEQPWKMEIGKEYTYIADLDVRHSDIDTNAHVNNVSYIRLAAEVCGLDKPVRRLRVNYKKAAVLGDRIYISRDENGAYILHDADREVYAAVGFVF